MRRTKTIKNEGPVEVVSPFDIPIRNPCGEIGIDSGFFSEYTRQQRFENLFRIPPAFSATRMAREFGIDPESLERELDRENEVARHQARQIQEEVDRTILERMLAIGLVS